MGTTLGRIAPLNPPYEPETKAMLDKWMPPNSGMDPLALFRTLGRHGELASRSRPLGSGILAKGLVEPGLREVMIHRTCALTGAEYEWGVHVMAFGRPLGMTEGQLRSTVYGGPDDAIWTAVERAVFRLADALHASSSIDDQLFGELKEHFSDEQIIELCMTAGWYHALSYVINVCGIAPEPWAACFADVAEPARSES